MTTKPGRPLVIFHNPCLDGFTAAWAVWLQFPNAEFFPGVYGQAPPDCTGRNVYLVDFSYKRPVMEQIMAQANSVLVLDHHKTAEADLANLWKTPQGDQEKTAVLFDMEKSGARLAWEWFHPNTEVPRLVRYVEDRDLWRFKLPYCRELNAAVFSYAYDFQVWNDLRAQIDYPLGFDTLVKEGRAIERKHHKDIAEILERTRHTLNFTERSHPDSDEVAYLEIPCANMPYTMASDAANKLAEENPFFGATYYLDSDGAYVFSLRSKETGADVSLIAARYGGGGHKHAAGFKVNSLEEL